MNKKMEECFLNQYIQQIEKLRSPDNPEFSHLSNKIYLDHAANGIYMNSLIKDYYEKLTRKNSNDQDLGSSFFSNPHSHNLSGIYTNIYIDLVRQKILDLFNTSQNEYDVVFVMNATHGLKLLAETFNFNEVIEIDDYKSEESSQQSSYFAYLNDNHTSVIGLREIVWSNHPLTKTYCLFEDENLKFNAKLVDSPFQYRNNAKEMFKNRSLLVYPAQSNFNGRKYDLDIINDTQNNGLSVNISNEEKKLDSEWFVCLDTASYVSTSELDLTINKPDFLVVSFYKIFGFPTGIGALIIRKNERIKKSLSRKTYFGGGTVSMALIDENKVCFRNCSIKNKQTSSVNNFSFHAFLEDGTIPYLEIIALDLSIEKFKKLTFEKGLRLIQDHDSYLMNYCIDKMTQLEHFNAQKLVEIYRKEINNSIKNNYGPILSFNLKNSIGSYIGFRLVDKLAQENQIYLRTGCFCNIGACQIYMKHLKDNESFLENFKLHGHECGDHIDMINDLPTGAIRISFGYCSIKQDVDKFIQFLSDHFIEYKHDKMTNHIMNIENIKLNKMDLDNIEKQYFKINQIYIYPIKSCAPMKIKDKWSMSNGGFIYDRNWLILDSNLVPLTQKRFKLLTKIKPFIDIDRNILRLEYDDESFEMQLEAKHEIIQNKLIHIKNLTCYDQGDHVSEWLSRNVFKTNDKFKLVRICDSKFSDSNNKTSFVNKADYLLINENSIHKLKTYLDSNLTDENNKQLSTMYSKSFIDEYLCLQFRPNIVVSTISSKENFESSFDEEFWINIKILNKSLDFEIVENCTRCQMININQSELQENDYSNSLSFYNQMLLKQLYKLKSNSKFGIYLSKKADESKMIIPLNDSSKLNINENISCKLNNELSIGDIGVAFKYKYCK